MGSLADRASRASNTALLQELAKFNANHDSRGRFAHTAGTAAPPAGTPLHDRIAALHGQPPAQEAPAGGLAVHLHELGEGPAARERLETLAKDAVIRETEPALHGAIRNAKTEYYAAQPEGAAAHWDYQSGTVRVGGEVSVLQRSVLEGKTRDPLDQYEAVSTLVHELYHASSPASGPHWDTDPLGIALEEGMVERKAMATTRRMLYGKGPVPAVVGEIGMYPRERRLVEALRQAGGDHELAHVWGMHTGPERSAHAERFLEGHFENSLMRRGASDVQAHEAVAALQGNAWKVAMAKGALDAFEKAPNARSAIDTVLVPYAQSLRKAVRLQYLEYLDAIGKLTTRDAAEALAKQAKLELDPVDARDIAHAIAMTPAYLGASTLRKRARLAEGDLLFIEGDE